MRTTLYNTNIEQLERECEVAFVRGTGPGGQHRNKRYTGVRLVHEPSGLVQTATERRSQSRNRALAFERLSARLEDLNTEQRKARTPRQETPVPRRAREARLESKRRRSETKKARRFQAEF